MVMEPKTQTYVYSNECDLEIHCSPFGLSGLYIKIRGTDIVGIGSTMGRITGSTTGTIHYNNSDDLIDTKYKLYVVIDEAGMLRIDFTKIFHDESKKKDGILDGNLDGNMDGGMDGSLGGRKSSSGLDSDKEKDKDEDDEIPSLIFRGLCPEGHPDKIEPFIGIFSFEREE